MTDLSLVLEDDIWEELKKRYEACVLITLKSLDKEREKIAISYQGGKATCIGLAERCKDRILRDFLEEDKNS